MSIPGSKNAFTHASQPLANWLTGSGQLLAWLLFHPTAWRRLLGRLDERLSPFVSLSELSGTHWRTLAWQRLVVQGYLISPLIVWLAIVGGLWISGRLGVGVFAGLIFGLLTGISFGLAVSQAAGLAAGVLATAIFTLLIGGRGVVVFDLLNNPGLGLACGAIAGIAGYVLSTLEERDPRQSMARRLGGLVIGVIISTVGMVVVLTVPLGIAFAWQNGTIASGWASFLTGGSPALIFSLTIGLRTRSWRRGVVAGTGLGLFVGLLYWLLLRDVSYNAHISGIQLLVPFMAAAVSSFLILFILPFVLAERVAGPWAGAIAGVLASQALHPITGYVFVPYNWRANLIASVLAGLTLLTMAWWRPLLFYPFLAAWHTILYRLDTQREQSGASLLRWHAAFWDEQQRLPLAGLEDHLVWVMERYPAEGQAAIDYLNTGHQRWAAQAAQIEFDARFLERVEDINGVSEAFGYLGAGQLAGPASALLRSLSRTSQDTAAALQQRSAFNQRLALRAISERLDRLQRELTRSNEPYAGRFQPVIVVWRQIITGYVHELEEAVERRQEIDNPYVIGVPLTAEQKVFVGRTDISQRIESLLLDRRRPPLLLYGQRRMGKTSLLNNLGRLLPNTILPLFVDLQGHVSYTSDHAGFFYNVARAMGRSAEQQRRIELPIYTRERFAADPLTTFDEWLDDVESVAQSSGSDTILLALDEFEALDSALVGGNLSEAAVLGSLRHLIQHRPRFKVLLSGSHTLQEFQRWASYFINAQVIHITTLRDDEALQLIERPVQGFALRYETAASRRVLELTHGHPFLLQLLCSEIVTLKNEQEPLIRRLASIADVEAAVPLALEVGSLFFADIEQNQVNRSALGVLQFLAAQGEGKHTTWNRLEAQFGSDHSLAETLALLSRRELIEHSNGGYRYQVELIRRWFVAK